MMPNALADSRFITNSNFIATYDHIDPCLWSSLLLDLTPALRFGGFAVGSPLEAPRKIVEPRGRQALVADARTVGAPHLVPVILVPPHQRIHDVFQYPLLGFEIDATVEIRADVTHDLLTGG